MKKHFPLTTLLFLSLLLGMVTVQGMQKMENNNKTDTQPLVVYTIPGIDGSGSGADYVKKVLGSNIKIVKVGTPDFLTDLGQYFCSRYLTDALQKESREGIVYATSQGTATALNYPDEKIQALILESVLASGNSAICHRANGPLINMPFLKYIPFSYYWVPYLATFYCLGYRPAGKQPIKSLDALCKNIPIIIVHSKEDFQLSYNDACAVYYGLRLNGNKNVYLIISKKEGSHTNILEDSEREKTIIRQILQEHGLLRDSGLEEDLEELNLSEFQPDPAPFKKHYYDLKAKETKHEYVEYALGVLLFCFGIVPYIIG